MTPLRAILPGILLGLFWYGTAHAIPPITLLGTSQSSVADTTGSFTFALPSQYNTATSVTVIGVCATSGTDDPTGNSPLTDSTITCPAGWTEVGANYKATNSNWLPSSPFSASDLCYRFYNAGDPANVTLTWSLSSTGFAVASALTYTGVQYSPAVESSDVNQFGGIGQTMFTSTFSHTLTHVNTAVANVCGHVFDRAAPQVTGVGIHISSGGATLETQIKNANVNGPVHGLADKDNTGNVPCGPGNCNIDGDFPFPTATPTPQFPFVNWSNGIVAFINGTPSPSPTPTPTPSPTPSPTPTPSATPTPTASPPPTGTAAPTQSPHPVVTPFVCTSSWPNCVIVQHGIPFGPTPNGGNIQNPGIFLEQPPPFTATYPGNDYCCSVVYPCSLTPRCLCEWHSNTCYYVEPFDPFHFH